MNKMPQIHLKDTFKPPDSILLDVKSVRHHMSKIESNLSPDLRSYDYKDRQGLLDGHCAVASEAFYFILGVPNFGLKSWCAQDTDNTTHWWLELNNTMRLDITVEQYGERLQPYRSGIRGRPCGFMGQRVDIGNQYGFNRRPRKTCTNSS